MDSYRTVTTISTVSTGRPTRNSAHRQSWSSADHSADGIGSQRAIPVTVEQRRQCMRFVVIVEKDCYVIAKAAAMTKVTIVRVERVMHLSRQKRLLSI